MPRKQTATTRPITIEIARLTVHGRTPDPIGQREAALLSTTPALGGGPHAELAAFGGVDAEETNALAVDLDGVAVDDGGDADDAVLGVTENGRPECKEQHHETSSCQVLHDPIFHSHRLTAVRILCSLFVPLTKDQLES